MPSRTPPYRQAFRVYDPRETEPDIRLDERFQLAIAAPFCAREVEVALGLLFYGQTGIAADWCEIFELIGAAKRTAYGFAYLVPGCLDNLDRVKAILADREAAGDRLFIVIQMFSWEQDFAAKLQIVSDLQDAVQDAADPDCAFEVNMGRGGEPPHTLLSGFSRVWT